LNRLQDIGRRVNLTKVRGSDISMISVIGETSRRAAARGSTFFPKEFEAASIYE